MNDEERQERLRRLIRGMRKDDDERMTRLRATYDYLRLFAGFANGENGWDGSQSEGFSWAAEGLLLVIERELGADAAQSIAASPMPNKDEFRHFSKNDESFGFIDGEPLVDFVRRALAPS